MNFTRPLRRLCPPILAHNLCCCYSGKRKEHNDVYTSLKVRLNSNISEKVWPCEEEGYISYQSTQRKWKF